MFHLKNGNRGKIQKNNLSLAMRPNLSFIDVQWWHQMKERFFTHEKQHY